MILDGLASNPFARLEFATAVHRHRREGKLSELEARAVFASFKSDEEAGYWRWYGVTQALLDGVFSTYQSLAPAQFVRTNDALHLACALEQGFQEIYSNDQHLLAAASAFSLDGIDVIPSQ